MDWSKIFKRKKKTPPKIKVYLAGPMDDDWRSIAIRRLLDLGYEIVGPKKFYKEKYTEQGRENIVRRNLNQISQADICICWINREECYATILECGMFLGEGVPVYLGFETITQNIYLGNWFMRKLCNVWMMENVDQFIVSVDREIHKKW